jgi:hypothetical protein
MSTEHRRLYGVITCGLSCVAQRRLLEVDVMGSFSQTFLSGLFSVSEVGQTDFEPFSIRVMALMGWQHCVSTAELLESISEHVSDFVVQHTSCLTMDTKVRRHTNDVLVVRRVGVRSDVRRHLGGVVVSRRDPDLYNR